jgi:DNA repair protein RecN (Recombination protein N)
LDKLNPLPDEWETLNADHTRLSHAQALLDAAQHALRELDNDDQGVLAQLAKAQNLLVDQASVEPEFDNLADVLASSLAQASDAAHSLQAWLRRTDLDPQRLQSLDERMGLWMSLARRHKRQPAELPGLLQFWRSELQRLALASALAALEKAQLAARQAYQTEARRISQARGRGAPKLAKAITQSMQGLGMQGGRFEVALNKLPQAQSSGLEEVAFLVAGHAGSTPRPVGKVASGGELSRIALAIAVTTSALGQAQTLIFDEVDSGVGGAVAETVGRLMQQLGADRQVLAVTHLPQVAACAHHHWLVTKRSDKTGSFSQLQAVTADERVQEVARMLGGDKRSDTSLAHAREMLQNLSQGAGA